MSLFDPMSKEYQPGLNRTELTDLFHTRLDVDLSNPRASRLSHFFFALDCRVTFPVMIGR